MVSRKEDGILEFQIYDLPLYRTAQRPVAHQKKEGVRIPGMQLREYIHKKTVFFYREKPSHMTDDHPISCIQFFPHSPAHVGVISKSIRRDSVPDNRKWISGKHPFACSFTACEKMGGIRWNMLQKKTFNWVFPVFLLVCAVGMGNADRDAGKLCEKEGDRAHTIKMAVYDSVFRMVTEESKKCPVISGMDGIERREPINSATQGQDFIIIICLERPMHQEIKLKPSSVKVAVTVHQKGFQAASAHIGDDMQNTDRHANTPFFCQSDIRISSNSR